MKFVSIQAFVFLISFSPSTICRFSFKNFSCLYRKKGRKKNSFRLCCGSFAINGIGKWETNLQTVAIRTHSMACISVQKLKVKTLQVPAAIVNL